MKIIFQKHSNLRTATRHDATLAQKARSGRDQGRGLLDRVERLCNGRRSPDVAVKLRLAKDFLAPLDRREAKENGHEDKRRTAQLLRVGRGRRRRVLGRDHGQEAQDENRNDEEPRHDVIIQVCHLICLYSRTEIFETIPFSCFQGQTKMACILACQSVICRKIFSHSTVRVRYDSY
jgi:hypothetical protein